MNWQDAIDSLDTSDDNTHPAGVEAFENALRLSTCICWHEDFAKRVKQHWIHSWICTDTLVGLSVYRFDNEVVAVGFQPYRKSDDVIEFVSAEAANRVRDFIFSLKVNEEDFSPPIADLQEEIDPLWLLRH